MENFFAQRLLGKQICALDANKTLATQFSANAISEKGLCNSRVSFKLSLNIQGKRYLS